MKLPSDVHDKIMSAYQLLGQDIFSVSSFEHACELLKGLHPEIDKKLDICSKAIATIQKIQNGDIATLSTEMLPEETEKQKKRKKAILFFISSLKDLKNEIKRIDVEVSEVGQSNNSLWHMGRIIKFAKGPFGLVTLAALVIVGIALFSQKHSQINFKPTIIPSGKQIQVIEYSNKQIPLNELFVGYGQDCDSPHYHAIGEKTITTVDGVVMQDPGGCGFGKVKDVQVLTISR